MFFSDQIASEDFLSHDAPRDANGPPSDTPAEPSHDPPAEPSYEIPAVHSEGAMSPQPGPSTCRAGGAAAFQRSPSVAEEVPSTGNDFTNGNCQLSFIPTFIHVCMLSYTCMHYTYTHPHMYIHTYIHTYTHTYIRLHTYRQTDRHTYVRTKVHKYICTHACTTDTHIHIHATSQQIKVCARLILSLSGPIA